MNRLFSWRPFRENDLMVIEQKMKILDLGGALFPDHVGTREQLSRWYEDFVFTNQSKGNARMQHNLMLR